MKTTEQVNISGYSFILEEDAYLELEKYLANIRKNFMQDGNVGEIVLDIEERIAELLNEKCVSGAPVGIQTVMEICGRIGHPEELSENGKAQEQDDKQTKRLFRDSENRVLGGVCAGLGTYLNVDKVLFRLIFLAAFIVPLAFGQPLCISAPVIYACLWIAMPAARSVEDKCRMNGKPISLSNFINTPSQADIEREALEIKNSPAGKATRRFFMTLTGIFMTIIGFAGLLSTIFIHKAPEIIRLIIERHTERWGRLNDDEIFMLNIFGNHIFWWGMMVIVGIFCIWMLYNGIRLIFDMKSPSWKPGIILFVLWIISILALIVWILLQVAERLPYIIAL